MPSEYRVRHVRVVNYKGIEQLEADIPANGVVAEGTNGSRKTSFLDAIGAALAARNIEPSAVRLGADRAEILVDLGAASVRRVIKASGSPTLTVDVDDARKKEPAAFLRELLGVGSIDPIALLNERDPGKRQAKVLAAIPMTVTVADLQAHIPDLPANVDCSGHALAVVDRLRSRFEEARKDANRSVKDLAGELARAKKALDDLGDQVELDEGARAALDAARAENAALDARAREAAAAEQRTAATRRKIELLRETSAAARPGVPEDTTAAQERERGLVYAANTLIDSLEKQLAAAKAERDQHGHALADLLRQQRARESNLRDIERMEAEATALESAVAEASVSTPTDDERRAATESFKVAEVRVQRHAVAEQQVAAEKAVDDVEAKHAAAKARAVALDGYVQKLRTDIPQALIANSNAIPGLGVSGDDITLDGVSLNQVNAAERLRVAVRLAKRATRGAKILIIDELEKIAPDLEEEAMREFTDDGWQVFGGRVKAGELRLVAIESAHESSEAAE